MKNFLAIIGAFIMVTFILGMFGAVDFVLCIRGPGECQLMPNEPLPLKDVI